MKPQDEPIHIKVEKKSDIAPLVLMPGDPLRAKYIAEKFLDDANSLPVFAICLALQELIRGRKLPSWEVVWECLV